MLKKPNFLFFFALFLTLEPIFTISFISFEKEFTFWHVAERSLTLSPMEIFNFWFLFPISGFLIFSIKSYTYVLFILLQIYNVIFHLGYESYTWPYLSEKPSLSSLCLLGVNVFIVFYMLLPDTRKPFFDRRLRWWERASRFSIKEPCYYIFEGELYKAQLIDLSETGVLLSLQENKLTQGNFIKMDFKLLNEDYEINGEVVRKLNGKESENHLFGIQFKFDNIFQRYKMKFLHYSIKKSQKYPIYRK